MNYIIGAGGVGSWLTPAMCRLLSPQEVTVVDGDTLEERNLDRQLFDTTAIGLNKAEAMAQRHQCLGIPDWYVFPSIEHRSTDWLMVCVDNHAGRRAALQACDWFKCSAIIAANEVHSSEAYVYFPTWKDTNLDPRTYFPEINTDTTNNPVARAIGCTGEAQKQTPQLVTANLMAASLAAHLYVVWAQAARKLERSTLEHLPHRLMVTLSKAETYKAKLEPRKTEHERNE